MEATHLYQQIVQSVRQDIARGSLAPGDRLPSVRAQSDRWSCTPGTVHRAYQELARQGLVVSRAGQGTLVASPLADIGADSRLLRRASLIHMAESLLLEALSAGYDPDEVEAALRSAADHWRVISQQPQEVPERVLRFAGSHDPALSLLAARFPQLASGYALQVGLVGSLGGLIALARDEADLAGCHLWDEESNTYNVAFVRRLLPGRHVALLTLAHRRLGLLIKPGNPHGITGLQDLARPGLRFVNRQRGAGTRVWLDAQLRQQGVTGQRIDGYDLELSTHADVARAIAQDEADVGLGVEAAALANGLDFLFLTLECYDLVVPAEVWEREAMRVLRHWLASQEGRGAIAGLGGYETTETGHTIWV